MTPNQDGHTVDPTAPTGTTIRIDHLSFEELAQELIKMGLPEKVRNQIIEEERERRQRKP